MTTVYTILEWSFVFILCLAGLVIYRVHQERTRERQERELIKRREEQQYQLSLEKEQNARNFERAMTQSLSMATYNQANYTAKIGDLQISGQHRFPVPASHYKINEVKEDVKELPAPELPGPCDFSDMLASFRPSPQHILLALAPGGQPITVPLKALCHVALAGATNNGKSTLMRLLLSQLLYCNTRVILADPHFAPFDQESGDDWRPIANRLEMEPAVSYAAIQDTLRWLATDELGKRLERRRKSEPVGTPYFLAMDEVPAIVKHVPESPEYMADLLREGRKVGLYLVCAAQDWLVKTVGGSGAVRDCFRTAFYVGGDTTSARVLLDVKGRVDDGGLGKGVVMMRSSATPQAALSRVPYASNDALYDLLEVSPAASNPLQSRFTDELVTVDAETTSETTENRLDARSLRIRELLKAGTSHRQIIQEVYGVSGGAKYTEASKELSQIIAKLV